MSTETRGGEQRTDGREDGAQYGSSRIASCRFRLHHPQGRSEAEDPAGRSPEGLREAKGRYDCTRMTGVKACVGGERYCDAAPKSSHRP